MVFVLAATGLPLWGFALIAGLTALAVIAAAYYGVQSMKQAALLRDVVPYGQLEGRVGRSAAVSGRPKVIGGGFHLWKKTTFQEYRRNYNSDNSSSGSWHTVSSDIDANDFTLHCHGGEVSVRNRATEVHGTQKTTDYGGGGGGGFLSSLFSGGRDTRTIREVLPAGNHVTVIGKVVREGGSLALVKDAEVGMLLTSAAAGSAAFWESVKGWGGVVVLPVLWVVVAAYFARQYF